MPIPTPQDLVERRERGEARVASRKRILCGDIGVGCEDTGSFRLLASRWPMSGHAPVTFCAFCVTAQGTHPPTHSLSFFFVVWSARPGRAYEQLAPIWEGQIPAVCPIGPVLRLIAIDNNLGSER